MQQVRAFTHGPGWCMVLASSIGKKGLIIKSKATSAPPRAGTRYINKYIYIYISIHIYIYINDKIYIYIYKYIFAVEK